MSKKESLDENGNVRFTVYVPKKKKELINQYISYAKLYEDNQIWKVMRRGLNLIKKEDEEAFRFKEDFKALVENVNEIEERLISLEEIVNNNQEEKGPTTMGQDGG